MLGAKEKQLFKLLADAFIQSDFQRREQSRYIDIDILYAAVCDQLYDVLHTCALCLACFVDLFAGDGSKGKKGNVPFFLDM